MFTTIKNKVVRILLAASVILILSGPPLAPAVYASPVCGISSSDC